MTLDFDWYWKETQLRGRERDRLIDWGECLWTASDIVDNLFSPSVLRKIVKS